MTPSRPLLALTLALPLAGAAGEASGQNFFEQLFGIRPPPPQQRPLPPAPVGRAAPPPPEAPTEPAAPIGPVAPREPAPPKPVVLKFVPEDNVVGRELKLNGSTGSLRIERTGQADYRVRLSLQGARTTDETQSCTVRVGGGEPVALAAQGRPDGSARFELQSPLCPIRFDVLEGAVLVTAPDGGCTFAQEACKADVKGLWGPEPAELLPKARDTEQARGNADRAVRENYKALTQRVKPTEVRGVVSEQAAFSSEREQLCRSYSREPAHGFCNARFTEARAASLAARLGIAPASPTAEAAPPRRRRPPEASQLPETSVQQ